MDLVGKAMGLATIPMALLTVWGCVAGLILLAGGHPVIVTVGVFLFAICFALAIVVEQIVIRIDDLSARMLPRRRAWARAVALLSGVFPMLVLLVSEYLAFRLVLGTATSGMLLPWLWSYTVATGPWTLFTRHVSRYRRSLCGIRAYAGHLAYWLLSLNWLANHEGAASAFLLMMVPAILPVSVGVLLALADREALKNVRV